MTLDAITPQRPRLSDRKRAEIANDLLLLARLHQRPIDRETVVGLWQRCYDGLLQLRHSDSELRRSLNGFCRALTDIPTCFDTATGTTFREDFARLCAATVMLSGPTQLDALGQDWDWHVSRQSVDHWIERHGESPDPTTTIEPNRLALELRQIAYLMAADGVATPSARMVEMLGGDYHECLARMAINCESECQTQTYRSLAHLTAAYIRFLTGLLDAEVSQSAQLAITHHEPSTQRQEIHHA